MPRSSLVDQCPRRDTLPVLGDFNASTGTDRDGYETCVGPHGSGTMNQNSTKFLDFARSQGLRVAGSWFQHPQAHCWTWYSNAGDVAKEIDHMLVDGCWRMIQNCRVYRRAQFLNTDHRLVVVALKLQLKCRRMVPSQPRLDVGKLKDERVVEIWGPGTLGDPEELDSIDQIRRARLNGRAELFRELKHKTECALRVDKEAYVQGICEGVEHHLW